MPKSSEQQVKEMSEQVKLLTDHLQKSEKASKGLAENFEDLHRQIDRGHLTILDYLKAVVKVPQPFKELSRAIVTSKEDMSEALRKYNNDYLAASKLQEEAELRLSRLRSPTSRLRENREKEVQFAKELAKQAKANMDLEGKRLDLHERIGAVTGKNLAVEYLIIRASADAVKRSGEINESLMQANSLYRVRRQMADDINEIQSRTGASLESMLGATKALVNVWPKGRGDFKNVLETIVQMREGLGVSFENSAKMAQIFQLSLKTPVRSIADDLAAIANSTSLAADEAARFAVETGKALRLLGPGGASQVREVTKYVTALAARMQDVGGDASDVMKVFNEMTKGSAQGFMLRGLTGVTNPRGLGTEAGTQAAMTGIDRMIKKIVTAGPGSPAYLAQLESASQVLNMSTESIVLWSDMMKKANEPLDEHAKLQQRWREQTEQANKAFNRIRESIAALVQRALSPMIPTLTSIMGGIANFIGFLAAHKTTAYTTTVIFMVAVAKTIWSLGRLAISLIQVTVAARAAAAANVSRQLNLPGMGGPIGNSIKSIISPILTRIMAGFGGLTGILSSLGKLFMRSLPGMLIAASGIAGYKLGQLIDRKFPDNFVARATRYFEAARDHLKPSVVLGVHKTKTAYDVMAEVRRDLLAGKTLEAQRYFMENARLVKGLVTEKGASSYLDLFEKTATEVRERAGLTTTIVPIDEQRRFNQKQLEQQQEMVKNTGGAARILKEVKEQDKMIEDMRNSRTHAEFMRRANEFRMLKLDGDYGGRKTTLSSPGAP